MTNSTLNMVQIEIARLKEKQQEGNALDMVEMKKLESLIKMRKEILTTPKITEETEMDEEIFSDKEIERFLSDLKEKERKLELKNDIKAKAIKSKKAANRKKKKVLSKR